MEGDRQRDLEYHGGRDRALVLYSLELIDALQREGHPVSPGSMGENVVLAGIDWATMVPGTRLRLGEVEIELTAYAPPCRTIKRSFSDARFGRVSSKSHPGWSRVCARVVTEGVVSEGDGAEIL